MNYDDEPRSTRYLIERQRKLGESPRPIDRLRAVALGGALSDRLNGLSDRQIGQLLFDFCWPELYVDGPELIIVTQAIDRLRRSTGGAVTNEEAQDNLKQRQSARNVETRCFCTTELTNLISGCVTAWPAGARDTSASSKPQISVKVRASTRWRAVERPDCDFTSNSQCV